MAPDKLSDLPDWDDRHVNFDDEEGEEWKPNPTREACKALYIKWQEVVFILNGIIKPFLDKEKIDNEEESAIYGMMQFAASDMHADAHMVAVKIKSSEAGGIYVIRMENAAIIRKLAQGIATNLLLFLEDSDADERYITIVRDEITAFRKLFIEWTHTFEKDEFADEWGLFV